MKIAVHNLGMIKEAEIDLKPLTIFIGPNNAGKTWLAYTLSAILGQYGWPKYTNACIADEIKDTYPILDTALDQILEGGNATIDLVQFTKEYGEVYINNVARFARRWMREFMSTARASFENLEVYVSLTESKENIMAQVLSHSLTRKLSVGKRKPLLNALKEPEKRELYIYTSTEESISEKLPRRAIKEFLVLSAFDVLNRIFFSDTPTFPAERTTFITFPFGAKREGRETLITNNTLQQEQRTIRPLIGPVGYFLTMISNSFRISSLRKEEREEEAKKNERVRTYTQLAQVLEGQILRGRIDFSTPEPNPSRELLFHADEDITIELSIASSMVKELSSLVLYLRYLAEPGDRLIIDEPEMNLHPEAQVQLTEFLVMLVNAGLHILITTHSPYIVDHLSNLMKAAESREPEAIEDKFYLRRKDAFISKNVVSVYLVDQGKAENILDEDGVVHWGTFGTVSDRVSEIYFEL
jgi:AAA ATPase-like protein